MHRIWSHASVFLIRPTPAHDNTLQVILKISIFQFADPTKYNKHDLTLSIIPFLMIFRYLENGYHANKDIRILANDISAHPY